MSTIAILLLVVVNVTVAAMLISAKKELYDIQRERERSDRERDELGMGI